MNNPIEGTAIIEIGGNPCVLHYDWRAVARIKTKYADKYDLMNPEHLADFLLFGLVRHQPEISLDRLYDLSPPIVPTMEKVNLALGYAYFGPDKPEDKAGEGGENPPTAATTTVSPAP